MTKPVAAAKTANAPRVKRPNLSPKEAAEMAVKYAQGATMQELMQQYHVKQSAFYRYIRSSEGIAEEAPKINYAALCREQQAALADLYLHNRRLQARIDGAASAT